MQKPAGLGRLFVVREPADHLSIVAFARKRNAFAPNANAAPRLGAPKVPLGACVDGPTARNAGWSVAVALNLHSRRRDSRGKMDNKRNQKALGGSVRKTDLEPYTALRWL